MFFFRISVFDRSITLSACCVWTQFCVVVLIHLFWMEIVFSRVSVWMKCLINLWSNKRRMTLEAITRPLYFRLNTQYLNLLIKWPHRHILVFCIWCLLLCQWVVHVCLKRLRRWEERVETLGQFSCIKPHLNDSESSINMLHSNCSFLICKQHSAPVPTTIVGGYKGKFSA